MLVQPMISRSFSLRSFLMFSLKISW